MSYNVSTEEAGTIGELRLLRDLRVASEARIVPPPSVNDFISSDTQKRKVSLDSASTPSATRNTLTSSPFLREKRPNRKAFQILSASPLAMTIPSFMTSDYR